MVVKLLLHAFDLCNKIFCVPPPGECSVTRNVMDADPFATQRHLLQSLYDIFIRSRHGEIKSFHYWIRPFHRSESLNIELSFIRFEDHSLFADPQDGARPYSLI